MIKSDYLCNPLQKGGSSKRKKINKNSLFLLLKSLVLNYKMYYICIPLIREIVQEQSGGDEKIKNFFK